ncbi:MAG: 3-isopropylmalate dehydratase small subunit [Nitrococcus sp.]|nr:3-isopropylmalate dehydratase small subunit [Nitrococcus sp.]
MQPLIRIKGVVAPLDRANVDTDAIIPAQFLKSIKRTGFGPNLFDAWRYLDHGEPGQDCAGRPQNPDFVLNELRYQGASILLARRNFGCGSSREHAPWALKDYGFRVLIAPSFAEIFYNNCVKNGVLPVALDEKSVEQLFQEVAASAGYTLEVDLPSQAVTTPSGQAFCFEIDAFRKQALLDGLDEIGLTLQHAAEIRAYEERRRRDAPWLFQSPDA